MTQQTNPDATQNQIEGEFNVRYVHTNTETKHETIKTVLAPSFAEQNLNGSMLIKGNGTM